jgi:hypothetical protein
LENRSGSLFRLLSPHENLAHHKTSEEANKAEKQLREEGKTQPTSPTASDDETDWHDDTDVLPVAEIGIKRWQWSVNFKGMEEFVEKHGDKGGGLTDGWAVNRGWVSVTALRAAFQVVDGGAGGIYGGEEIILKS